MASSSSLIFFLLLLLLLPCVSLAQSVGYGEQRRLRFLGKECQLDRLSGMQPRYRFESEAGVTEIFDEDDQQLQCASVSVIRRTLKPLGLFLPAFSNNPSLSFGFEHGRGQSERLGDEHQKILHFRQGDILAIPAGVAHWWYNSGDRPLVAISFSDTSSSVNQLDKTHRQFMLAGTYRKEGSRGSFGGGQQYSSSYHAFRSFDTRLLGEALGISQELAQEIQREDPRGEMVMVREGLKLVFPPSKEQLREEEEESYGGLRGSKRCEGEEETIKRSSNGVRVAFCTARLRENINDPRRADIFVPHAGWLKKLTSQKLPILGILKLSATRGVLHRQAITSPLWNVNAHCIVYVTRGRGRVQVVNDEGRAVHSGEIRQGQLLVVPQNFVMLIKAEDEGFEWVSFKTNDNAIESQIAGKASVLRGLPVDVVANAFRLRNEDAFKVKFGRADGVGIFPAHSSQEELGRPYAVV
ncbi:Glutelin type-A 1 [Apostasia shenzhenica]|uniref:Glutelin type-A 1 n=1 Tax=Apostasia shenzhenica TaxID=1088818 RepID=A0A2H9ZT18_9ASPA|nr:Glutelin type-A 1 [Apostasia shenzhenica]